MPLYLPCLNPKPLVEKSMGEEEEEEEEEEQNREAGSKSRAKNLREIRDLLGL